MPEPVVELTAARRGPKSAATPSSRPASSRLSWQLPLGISFSQDVAMTETRAAARVRIDRNGLFIGARTWCKRVAVPALMNSAQKKRRTRRLGAVAKSIRCGEESPADNGCRIVVADCTSLVSAIDLNSDPVSWPPDLVDPGRARGRREDDFREGRCRCSIDRKARSSGRYRPGRCGGDRFVPGQHLMSRFNNCR